MHPRGTFDIGWLDLAFAVGAAIRPDDRETMRGRVEQAFAPRDGAFACLSVRTGFDALLTALDLPAGSELLVSVLTIRDMVTIAESHGLVVVPVDLDMERLSLDVATLEAQWTTKTRALLVAHVFGSRMALDDAFAWAHARGLIAIEDCAQAYAGRRFTGHPAADVSMFSLGPIKTNTALQGGLLRVSDPALLASVRAIESDYSVQPAATFTRRVIKYSALKTLNAPIPFTLFSAGCSLIHRPHDQVINAALRGFAGPELLAKIRWRPSYPLLALMERKLVRYDEAALDERAAAARELIADLPDIEIPGAAAASHSFWVFPILSRDPDTLMHALWRAGFDATRGTSSLSVVPPPCNRPEATAPSAAAAMARVLYLPTPHRLSRRERRRMASVVVAFERGSVAGTLASPAPVS